MSKPVQVIPGYLSAVPLRAVPKTSLTVDGFSVDALQGVVTTLTVRGSVDNLPAETPYAFSWLIESETGTRAVPVPTGDLPAFSPSGDAWELTLEVDVFALQLLGQGKLGARIAPEFPYCEPATLEPSAGLPFDNDVVAKVHGQDGDLRIGSKLSFSLVRRGVLKDLPAKVVLEESDEGEVSGQRNLSRSYVWKAGETHPQGWRLGCNLADNTVRFDYQDDQEKGDFEFVYRVLVKPEGQGYVPLRDAPSALPSVPRPRLESLEVELSPADEAEVKRSSNRLWRFFYLGSNDTELQDVYVTGKITGFAPDLPVRFRVSLWVRDGMGAARPWGKTAKASNAYLGKGFTLKGEETFRFRLATFGELYEFSFLGDAELRGKDRSLFPILRCFTAAGDPFDLVIGYETSKYGSAAGAAGATSPWAKGVAPISRKPAPAQGGKGGSTYVPTGPGWMTDSNLQVGGKHFVDWFNQDFITHADIKDLKAEMHGEMRKVFGKPIDKANFKQIFDRISILAGVPAISLPEFLAHLAIMYNETGGTMTPREEAWYVTSNLPWSVVHYTWKKIPGGKISYNHPKYNRKAGDLLEARGHSFKSASGTKVHWNSSSLQHYPDENHEIPFSTIRELDFYKFRGRGFNQLTFRSNYLDSADPVLIEVLGRTSDQLSDEELSEAFRSNYDVSCAIYYRYYAKRGHPQRKALDGDFAATGKATGGSEWYHKVVQQRCELLKEHLEAAGVECSPEVPMAPGAQEIVLTGSVGDGGDNDKDEVKTVKQRFVDLGFDWIKVDDKGEDPEFIKVINLFQSIKGGKGSVSGDGVIDKGGTTHDWLQAANAPRWVAMDDEGPGFRNYTKLDQKDEHHYCTDWLAQVVRAAAKTYEDTYRSKHPKAAKLQLNDMSSCHGGHLSPHGSHQTGLDLDFRLPKEGGGSGGITYKDDEYDQDAFRAMLQAFEATGRVALMYFNDPDLIAEGLCKPLDKHSNHAHVRVKPPTPMGCLMIPTPEPLD